MPLKDDDPEKWGYTEHTKIKHEILSKYLETWIRILGVKYKKLYYIDCFAGRGIYADGTAGSPIIALQSAKKMKKTFSYLDEISCIFVEKNPNNFENMKKIVYDEINTHPNDYTGIVVQDLINDEFIGAMPKIKEYYDFVAPSFYFIDPFGYSGVPFESIKTILQFPKTEVFINFMVRDIHRFLDSTNHKFSIDDFFGLDNVKNIVKEMRNQHPKLEGKYALLELYKKQLHDVAAVKYVLSYDVYADKQSQTTYYLIHATNHIKGCEVMKNIMYKAGTEGRFSYLGPDNGQMTIMQYGDLSELKEYLLNKFDTRTIQFKTIISETLMDTKFIEPDYKKALLELETESKILITGKGARGGLEKSDISFNSSLINEKLKSNKNMKTYTNKPLDQF
ncbi:MAG TPA: three-Cys-motif partner protein TcmP [Anaerovoracaceae bacterium]|nr:three-Cys-motif partner protein TcmP [Anaerovoracaceae bacterium]